MGRIKYKYQVETIQKLAKIGFWELDLEKNDLTWTDEIYNIFGLDKKLFKPSYEDFLNAIHEEDRELVNSAYLKSLEDKKDYSVIHRLKMSDGKIKYVKEQCKTIFDETGKALISQGTIQDITELTLAKHKIEEEALQLKLQQEELEAIFNNTIDGLAIVDKDTNFLKVNKTYCEITGFSQEELLKTSCIALTSPEDIEKTIQVNEEFLKGDKEHTVLEKTCFGKYRKIEAKLYASWLPNKEHILVNMKDLSKDNLLQEQAKLFSMKEMLESVAHQWRQPLSTISSVASGINLLKQYDKLDNHDFQKDMNTVLEQVNYLSNTIDDLSNFVVKSDELEPLSIVSTFEKALNIFSTSATINGIQIITNLNDDLIINAYSNELIQAFINILTNSKDALLQVLDERLILITTKKEKNQLILEIKDSGGGVDKSIKARIFEPYFTTKHQSFGTGIGLSMTHKFLTSRHNAHIKLDNSEFIYRDKNHKGLSVKIYFNG